MRKKKLGVGFRGEEFSIDKVVIKDGIREGNISNEDRVLDIGGGKGFVSVDLLKMGKNVVGIEKERGLVEDLGKLFCDGGNVEVVGCDFRNFGVGKFGLKVV